MIENETPHVARVEYIPRRRRSPPSARRGRGEDYELLGSNPLPDTFRVYPDKPDNISQDPQRAGAARAVGRPRP